MSSNVTLRLAQRSDIPTLSHLANAGYAQSALHRHMVPYQERYPLGYYYWRRNIIRQRFATPTLRTIVAVDSLSSGILGHASWAVEGIEKEWARYVMDKCVDHKFLDRFSAGILGDDSPARPPCLHCYTIVVEPSTQCRGIGRMLIDWGKELAVSYDLPLYLEALPEVTGFYEKIGFSRLGTDLVVDVDGQVSTCVPVYVWEGKEREGRWLEQDTNFVGPEKRWRWRDDTVPLPLAGQR